MPLLEGASFFALVGFIQEPVARKGGESAVDSLSVVCGVLSVDDNKQRTTNNKRDGNDTCIDWQKTRDDADLRRQGRGCARDGRAGWAVSCDAGQDQRHRRLQR